MQPELFVDRLCELELEPQQLRRDRHGATWLPADLLEAMRRDERLGFELQQFVDEELAMFDEASLGDDAWFTARVMAQLPAGGEADAGIDPARRRALVGLGYLAAAAVCGAWLLQIGLAAESASEFWQSSWHAWVEAISVGGLALGVALVVTAAGLLWPTGAPAQRA